MSNTPSKTHITPMTEEYSPVNIEYTCTVCGALCDKVSQVPGFLTLYCDTCRVKVEQESNKERQKRYRENHKNDPEYKEAARLRQAEYRKAHAAEVRAKDAQRKREKRAVGKGSA